MAKEITKAQKAQTTDLKNRKKELARIENEDPAYVNKPLEAFGEGEKLHCEEKTCLERFGVNNIGLKKKCLERFEINDIVIGEPGDLLIVSDAIPSGNETPEDVDGYCDIKNKRTGEIFEATWMDIPSDGTSMITIIRGSNITGQKFGNLTAIAPTAKRQGQHVVWCCVCDCGNSAFVTANNLKSGLVKSCGCLKKKNRNFAKG